MKNWDYTFMILDFGMVVGLVVGIGVAVAKNDILMAAVFLALLGVLFIAFGVLGRQYRPRTDDRMDKPEA